MPRTLEQPQQTVVEDFSSSTQTRLRRQSSVAAAAAVSDAASADSSTGDFRVSPSDFELLTVIGKGAYGRVLQVREAATGQIYAMKVLKKGQVLHRNNFEYVREERNIMSQTDHPFVVTLMCAFQTETNLYLVMEFVSGGELFSHIRNEGIFDEEQTRFYSGEMVLAIEYLHQSGIIHRDLKPENVLLDARGHIRITDFGLAKVDRENLRNSKTLCGTDLYMAPEMIAENSKGYGKAVDFWSLGVIVFEMLTGDVPFYAKETQRLYKKILTEKPKFPRWMSETCCLLIKGLLNRNVEQRLGAADTTMFKQGGIKALKDHAFYKGLDWNMLARLEVKPPIVPQLPLGEGDTSNFDKQFTELDPAAEEEEDAQRRGAPVLGAGQGDDKDKPCVFSGFSFTRPSYLAKAMLAEEQRAASPARAGSPGLAKPPSAGGSPSDRAAVAPAATPAAETPRRAEPGPVCSPRNGNGRGDEYFKSATVSNSQPSSPSRLRAASPQPLQPIDTSRAAASYKPPVALHDSDGERDQSSITEGSASLKVSPAPAPGTPTAPEERATSPAPKPAPSPSHKPASSPSSKPASSPSSSPSQQQQPQTKPRKEPPQEQRKESPQEQPNPPTPQRKESPQEQPKPPTPPTPPQQQQQRLPLHAPASASLQVAAPAPMSQPKPLPWQQQSKTPWGFKPTADAQQPPPEQRQQQQQQQAAAHASSSPSPVQPSSAGQTRVLASAVPGVVASTPAAVAPAATPVSVASATTSAVPREQPPPVSWSARVAAQPRSAQPGQAAWSTQPQQQALLSPQQQLELPHQQQKAQQQQQQQQQQREQQSQQRPQQFPQHQLQHQDLKHGFKQENVQQQGAPQQGAPQGTQQQGTAKLNPNAQAWVPSWMNK